VRTAAASHPWSVIRIRTRAGKAKADRLREFEGAVRSAPDDGAARKALHVLRARFN
jgi:hypothetical protein